MYNVEFGETILLEKDEEYLLVDFGSKKPNLLASVSKHIQDSVQKESNFSFLISHFHDDHVNGVWETDLFDNLDCAGMLYVPELFPKYHNASPFTLAQLYMIADVLSSIILVPNYWKAPSNANSPFTLYQLFHKILDTKRHVQFLQIGSTFQFAHDKYQILWPDYSNIPLLHSAVFQLLNILYDCKLIEETAKTTGYVTIIGIDDFLNQLNEICNLFKEEPDAIYSAYDRLDQELQEAYDSMIRAITPRIAHYCSSLSPSQKRQIQRTWKACTSYFNQCSIVFHSTSSDSGTLPDSGILMTGDVTKRPLKNLIKYSMHPYYKMIKAPHHGTFSHYVNNLPACTHILISNGEGQSRYQKIHDGYGSLYGRTRKHTTIHCTNHRCNLYISSKSSPNLECTNCPKWPCVSCTTCNADCQNAPTNGCIHYPKCKYTEFTI